MAFLALGKRLAQRVRQRPLVGAAGAAGAVLLCGGLLYYGIYEPLKASRSWDQAQEALARAESSQARAHLAAFLELRPGNAEAHFLLARASRQLEDFAAAHEHLKQADRLRFAAAVVDLEFLLLDAQEFGPRGREEQLLHQYVRAQHPDEILILEALARGYMRTYRLGEAQGVLSQWIERFPDDGRPWLWRGEVFLEVFKLHLARPDLERSLQLRPDLVRGRLRLGQILLTMGLFPAAAQELQAYLQTDPDNPDAQLALARCLRALEQPEAARAQVQRLLARHPENASGWTVLGLLDLDAEKNAEALKSFQRAEALAPNELETYYPLALTLRRLGRQAEAEVYERRRHQLQADRDELALATKKLLADPKNLALRCQAGVLYLRTGRREQGVRMLQAVLQDDPKHAQAREALAAHQKERRDLANGGR